MTALRTNGLFENNGVSETIAKQLSWFRERRLYPAQQHAILWVGRLLIGAALMRKGTAEMLLRHRAWRCEQKRMSYHPDSLFHWAVHKIILWGTGDGGEGTALENRLEKDRVTMKNREAGGWCHSTSAVNDCDHVGDVGGGKGWGEQPVLPARIGQNVRTTHRVGEAPVSATPTGSFSWLSHRGKGPP